MFIYNAIVTWWSRDFDFLSQSHDSKIDSNIDLDSSFTFNQTSNIFHPKNPYTLLLAFNLLYTNLNTTSYILALAHSRAKILCILEIQSQAACLMAGLQEMTI